MQTDRPNLPNTGIKLTPSQVIILYERQDRKCLYCGDSLHVHAIADGCNLAIDHIVPRSAGGEDELCNYAIACVWCNRRKRTKSALQFLDEMRPYREKEKGFHD